MESDMTSMRTFNQLICFIVLTLSQCHLAPIHFKNFDHHHIYLFSDPPFLTCHMLSIEFDFLDQLIQVAIMFTCLRS